MKRIIAMLLLVVFMVSSVLLVSCGGNTPSDTSTKDTGNTDGTKDTSKQSETKNDSASDSDSGDPNDPVSRYEALDFGGDSVYYLIRTGDSFIIRFFDEFAGDIILYNNYQRTLNVQSLLNITMDGEYGAGTEVVLNRVINDVTSQTREYDIYDAHMKFGSYMAAAGYNLNLNKLPHIDFTQSYWNSTYTDNFAYKNYQFWATGDIDQNFIKEWVAMYVCDALWKTINNTQTMDDLFAMVEAGEWTLEKVNTYVEMLGWQDTDGDTVKSDGDTFGWILDDTGWLYASIAYGAGFNMSVRDGSKYRLQFDSPENQLIYNTVSTLVHTEGFQPDLNDSAGDYHRVFCDHRALFTHNTVNCIRSYLRPMDEYSVVPMPKLNEESPYRTPAYDGADIYGAVQNIDPERYAIVGASLDANAYFGRELVTEAFYETALRAKYSKNEGSYRTMGIIHDSAYADFAFCWTGCLDQIDVFLSNHLRGGTSLSTAAAMEQGRYQTLLDALYNNLNKVIKANKD